MTRNIKGHTMPQQLPPQDPAAGRPDRDEEYGGTEGALEPVDSFLELLNELNGHLARLEYALLDLKEALVQCDSGERRKLEREAATHLERIRLAARNDPGFPPLTE
jgi:hypothetical protein